MLIEAETYRWHGHYEGDAQPYKPEDEAAGWNDRDPLRVAGANLVGAGLETEERLQERPRRGAGRRRGRRRSRARRRHPRASRRRTSMSIATDAASRYMDALNAGIADAMEDDERVVLIGIDVGAGGGIFTVTKGLHERFGPDRVLDTPISEMGFVGAAVGAAMTGLRPIVEIMFMDFIGVCLDPILNQAAKLPYMTAGRAAVPDRLPHPDRRRPQRRRAALAEPGDDARAHPGPEVVMPATVTDAHDLLVAAVEDPNPVVFVESRRLYGMRGDARRGPAPDRQGARGARRRRRHRRHLGPDAARVPQGGRGVVRPRSRSSTCARSSRSTWRRSSPPPTAPGRLLVVHEAVQDFGAGAEIAARAGEELYDVLRVPVRRIGAPAVPMPFNPELERSLLPSARRRRGRRGGAWSAKADPTARDVEEERAPNARAAVGSGLTLWIAGRAARCRSMTAAAPRVVHPGQRARAR